VHDEVKNALAGGHLPSQHFAVNAAWFKLALLAYPSHRGLARHSPRSRVRVRVYRAMAPS
jgi:hypothetical protein